MPILSPLGDKEQRAFDRVPLAIPGKVVVLAEGGIQECLVIDLSLGGAGIRYDGPPHRSEMVCRLEIQNFGAFSGITTREAGSILGVRFLTGEAEGQNLLAKLTQYIKSGLDGLGEAQSHGNGLCLIRPSGENHHCDVENISLRGVALKTAVKPPVGELVRLGRMYGRIAGHHGEGISVRFVSFVDPLSEPAAYRA